MPTVFTTNAVALTLLNKIELLSASIVTCSMLLVRCIFILAPAACADADAHQDNYLIVSTGAGLDCMEDVNTR